MYQPDRFSSLTFNYDGTEVDQTQKCCVLAVDASGSVSGSQLYWDKVNEILNENLRKRYSNYKIVAWGTEYEDMSVQTFKSYILERPGNKGGTTASLIWDYLHQLKLTNYDLYFTTDGAIFDSDYDRYICEYNRLEIKPDNVTVYYVGLLSQMNMKFLDCFKKANYEIHGIDTNGKMVSRKSTKYAKDYIFEELIKIVEFEQIQQKTVENLADALRKLYKELYIKVSEYSENELNDEVGDEFKRFVDHLNNIVHCNYIDDEIKDNEAFEELFEDYKSNSKKIFDEFVRRFMEATSNDFQKVLAEIVELCNGRHKIERDLETYADNLNDDQNESSESDYDAEADDEDDIIRALNNSPEPYLNRPFYMWDPSEYDEFCVVWIGIDEIFGGDRFQQICDMETRHKLEKNSMQLFEILKSEKLNQKLSTTNHHIPLRLLAGLESFELKTLHKKQFKHIYMSPFHQVCCFGIILYNAEHESSWPSDMTENEKKIYFHNYATLTHMLFGESKFVGSLSLLHTFFLNIFAKCNRIDPFVKSCIMKTIERSTKILKCRIMMQPGLKPDFFTTVENAIRFHLEIYPKQIDTLTKHIPGIEKLNIPRRNIQCCSDFLSLGEDSFGIIYSEEYKKKLKLFQFWNYMLCENNMTIDEKLLHFKQIALTKILNWLPIDNQHIKIMFIEGKSKKSYFEYLDDIEFEEIVKLIVLFEKSVKKTLFSNICTKNIVLETSGEAWYLIKPIEKIDNGLCNLFNVEFCKAICDFSIVCPYTKKSRLECCGRDYPYVEKCRSLILIKSQEETNMQIPNINELKKYIISEAPLSIYHGNIDKHLEMVIKKFRVWNDWYKHGSENEWSKYLWISPDWHNILRFHNKMLLPNLSFMVERLKKCDCEAHSVQNANFVFKLAACVIALMLIYLSRHAITIAMMIACCIWISRNI